MILETWVLLITWIAVLFLWPVSRRAKLWFTLGLLLILSLWKLIWRYFWSYHWRYIVIMMAVYIIAAMVYTRMSKSKGLTDRVGGVDQA